nr:PD-(D/E)XK nuclease family protein [uncultured Rhodopila sp.]
MPRIVLGWWLDMAPAPSLGPWTAAVGPNGFLELLVSWLGVATRRDPKPVRVAALLAALREGPRDAFWSASFTRDPWSTAQAVLALRDALCMAGWDGTADADAPPRVADLARVSISFSTGEPDLLLAIQETLRTRGLNEIPSVMLAEPTALWPYAWQRLFAALAGQGVAIEDLPLPEAVAGQDLQALRTAMRDGTTTTWRGDGSLCLLAAETEAGAADVLSAWLGAERDDLAVVKASGGLLDPFLRTRHLPRLGGNGGAANGLLPLALALRWDPFDAAAALEFLSLHRTPLGRAARFLSDAIVDSPGHGGPRYQTGIRRAVRGLLLRLRAEGVPRIDRKRRALELIDEIGFWLPAQRYSHAEGLPAVEVVAVCERLVAWAQRRQDPDSVGPAVALAEAVAALRQDVLSRPLLGRMLDAVADASTTVSRAEAASWRHAAAPGALISRADIVVWWLTDPPAASPAPWRMAEQAWMAANALQPDDAASRRGRERMALLRAVSQTTERLMLVRPRAIGGDAAPAHPLLADLHACFGDSLEGAWTEAGSIHPGDRLAGRSLAKVVLPAVTPPPPLHGWTVPAGVVSRREIESPSGMELLLGCRLAWLLRYRAGLRANGPAMLPDMDRLTGNFLHRVLQQLFDSQAGVSDNAPERVRGIFERLLPQEGAPLMQPGQEATRARALTLLIHAVGVLTPRLTGAGLAVEAVERTLRRPLPGGGVLEGRLDLLLRRPADGQRLVLDAKWTRSNKRHREALASDKSVQLAAYAWLAEVLGQPSTQPVTAGYFLIRQAQLHTARGEPLAGAAVAGADLSRAWDRALSSYADGLDALRAGRVVAAGVPDLANANDDEDAELLVLDPPCSWCDYRTLCGASTGGR